MAASDRIKLNSEEADAYYFKKLKEFTAAGNDPEKAKEKAEIAKVRIFGGTLPTPKKQATEPNKQPTKIPTTAFKIDKTVKPAGIPIETKTEPRYKPSEPSTNIKEPIGKMSFTGGMDFPPTEGNTNAVDMAQVAAAVGKLQPTTVPAAKTEVPVAQSATTPIAPKKPAQMSGKVRLYSDEESPEVPSAPAGITTQASLADAVRNRLSKNEVGESTYTYDNPTDPGVVTRSTPTTSETVTINSNAPLSAEEFEKRKKGIEDAKQQRLDLSNQYRTSRLNSEEEMRGIQDIDLVSARNAKYKELMDSLDANRKSELWDKLIEAGGKIAAGALGMANIPGLPKTKGLDIASHYKYTPAFNREAEDKNAKEIFEVKKNDIEQTFKEKIAAIKQNVDLDAKSERDLIKEANTEFINAMDKLNNPTTSISTSISNKPNIEDIRLWRPEPPKEIGVVWNPGAYDNRQKQMTTTVEAIDAAAKSTRSDTFFNYGVAPQFDKGVNVNPDFIPQLDKWRDVAKEQVIDRNVDKIKSDTVKKQWANYKQNPNLPEAEKRAFLDNILTSQMSGETQNYKGQVNNILAGQLQRVAQLQVSAPNDQASIDNMREANRVFPNIPLLPVDQKSKTGPTSTLKIGAPTPTSSPVASRQSAWVATLPNGEIRKPIVATKGPNPTDDEVFNIERSKKDVGKFVSPDVAQAFLGKYAFTLQEEQFLPGKFSADGSTTLIGFGNLIPKIRDGMSPEEIAVAKKKQAKAEELDTIFNKYAAIKPKSKTDDAALTARQNLANQYKAASRDFYLSELNRHDPFVVHKDWFEHPTVANYWKDPNKQAVLFDLAWHGGPNADEVEKVVNLVNDELKAGKGKILPERDKVIAAEIAKLDPQIGHGTLGSTAPRSKRRAALWLGKQAK
jgi:hypothetical protein